MKDKFIKKTKKNKKNKKVYSKNIIIQNNIVYHVCLWKIKKDIPHRKILEIQKEVTNWKDNIPGILFIRLDRVKNIPISRKLASKFQINDISQFEKDYQKGYNYCMFIIFDSLKNRNAYDENKLHYRLSKKLLPALENGMKSILSFDITI